MNAAEHVRVNGTRSRALADGADPAVSGASVEALFVAAAKDRPIATFPDSQVDRASSPRDEGDRRRLVAHAHDAQRAVAAFEAEIPRCWWRTLRSLAVRSARAARQARAWSRSYCSAVNKNTPSSERSKPLVLVGWTCGRRTYWAGVEAMRPLMWAKR